MSNFEKTLKNSVVSVMAQVLTLLLSFINRRMFAVFLDIELLGYQSLFSNIFSILSVAELGIGNIISINLYKELVDKNENEIGRLMTLYKKIYTYIAFFILIAGLVLYPFLPYIVKDFSISKGYLTIIYFMQLGSVFADYFLSYKRTIYIADQKEYICTSTDLVSKFLLQILQMATLVLFRNYILYLAIQFCSGFFANIIIAKKSKRDYPCIQKRYKISKEYVREKKFFHEVKNFLIHKISFALYGSTDNIIISAYLGVKYVALYGNYYLLFNGVITLLFYKLLNPLQATIGKIVNSGRNKNDLWKQFETFDLFSFFFAAFIGTGFMVMFQPTIALWMGKECLLPIGFVILFSVTAYMNAVTEILGKYRSVFGEFEKDKNTMIAGAIVNIILSIILVQALGIIGIQLGTICGYILIVYGRIRFVIQNYFGKCIRKYFFKQFYLLMLFGLESAGCYMLTLKFPVSVLGIVERGAIIIIIPQVVNACVFWRNKNFREILLYGKRIFNSIAAKTGGKNQ